MPQRTVLDVLSGSTAWKALIPAAVGMAALFLLLPRPRGRAPFIGALAGFIALTMMGLWWTHLGPVLIENLLFYSFAGGAIVAGARMITHPNPVRSALAFALVVLCVCGLFLLQAAPFLMAATMIVYAGAIVVTFLFVIMLAQQEGLSNADLRSHEALFSCIAGGVLAAALVAVLLRSGLGRMQQVLSFPAESAANLVQRTRQASHATTVKAMLAELGDDGPHLFTSYSRVGEAARGSAPGRELLIYLRDTAPHWDEARRAGNVEAVRPILAGLADRGERLRAGYDADGSPRLPAENVAALGVSLFTDYFLAVELAGGMLLVATIGAIVIASRRGERLR